MTSLVIKNNNLISFQTITIGQRKLSILPIQIDNWIIHRNEEYITLNNIDGIKIKCDCHYKTCSIKIEGDLFVFK